MLTWSLLVLMFTQSCYTFSDVGVWDIAMMTNGEGSCGFTLAKSLFSGSQIIVMIHCGTMKQSEQVNITVYYLWKSKLCSPDYFHFFQKKEAECPSQINREFTDVTNATAIQPFVVPEVCENNKTIFFNQDRFSKIGNQFSRVNTSSIARRVKPLHVVERDGPYELVMLVESDKNFNLTVHIEMLSEHGYLSAGIWPFLPFFGVMCAVYSLLCASWLLVCALQWRDLLRIQFWIGGVALLGMVENATYYAVFADINRTGYFNPTAYMFAEWVSVAKRALARMLVIIVSLGFGIVKPRLGPALQRVLTAGILWGLLASIEAWLRLHYKKNDSNRDLLLSEAPLSLLDSAICWWIFVSLAHTMRTLQLRRNTVKLSLYKHFTNTLIFAVISSVIFMLYSIRTFRFRLCIKNWREVWVDEAYWHILFACILTVIMILWRPTNNNQRYAFTPLLDNADDDDEEEEQFVNDAYGVKMRGGSGGGGDGAAESGRGAAAPEPPSLDADLRWVEENIPASTLPLLDSDEEIINTKFEVSKMQ